jgi:hypothetical protein|tara:strand:- start:14235 stop:14477 length:243 start_codon:yes stop_codon:yes gene_type:complete
LRPWFAKKLYTRNLDWSFIAPTLTLVKTIIRGASEALKSGACIPFPSIIEKLLDKLRPPFVVMQFLDSPNAFCGNMAWPY